MCSDVSHCSLNIVLYIHISSMTRLGIIPTLSDCQASVTDKFSDSIFYCNVRKIPSIHKGNQSLLKAFCDRWKAGVGEMISPLKLGESLIGKPDLTVEALTCLYSFQFPVPANMADSPFWWLLKTQNKQMLLWVLTIGWTSIIHHNYHFTGKNRSYFFVRWFLLFAFAYRIGVTVEVCFICTWLLFMKI